MTSLSSLLSSHTETLNTLYSSLTSSPAPLIARRLAELEETVKIELNKQTKEIESLISQEQERLSTGQNKVRDWLIALGEYVAESSQDKEEKGTLEERVKQVELRIEGIRGRIKERGEEVVVVQKELIEMRKVLGGEEWDGVKLDDEGLVARGEWEGLDLRRERFDELQVERERARNELARRRDLINLSCSEILALHSELGPSTTSTMEEGDESVLEEVLLHLGVGGEGKQTRSEMRPTKENLEKVQKKRQFLEEEQAKRHETIQLAYDRLYPLWTMLGVPEEEMDGFVNQWTGSTIEVINAYQSELDRMLTLRRSNLSSFINAERQALSSLWDQLYLSHSERISRFPAFTISVDPIRVWRDEDGGYEEEIVNENVSEELLIRHEREREKVEIEVEDARVVLQRLERYFEIVEKGKALEAAAADPTRLTARGSSTKLLLEERDRKRVAKEKPKLEADLRALIPDWETKHRRPFLVDGIPFIESLDQQQRAEEMEKENKRRTKLGTSGSTSARPLRPQPTGTATPSIAPLKRQMTGRSTTSASSTSSSIHQPPAKRQVPMTTGSSTTSSSYYSQQQPPPSRPKSVLGDASTRIGNYRGGGGGIGTPASSVMKSGGRSRSNTIGRELMTPSASTTTGGGGGSGMRLPAGWGGGNGLQTQVTGATVGYMAPQRTGQFRPRPSMQPHR